MKPQSTVSAEPAMRAGRSVARPGGSGSVAWVQVSRTHYHHARMAAFAEAWPHPASIVQITDTDSVPVMEARPERVPYALHTLLPGIPSHDALSRPLGGLLDRALDRIRPGAVCLNGWSFGGGIEALRWSVRNGVPAIVMSESTAIDEPRRWFKEAVKRRLLALCSAALVGGAPQVSYLKQLGMPEDRIFQGYDVVDNGHFAQGAEEARDGAAACRPRLGLPENYFLASSRFVEKKNLLRLLQAFARFRALAPGSGWKLVLLGDGPLKAGILALANSLSLGDDLLLPGFLQYDQLPAYYGLASAFVHASTVEQWGLVVNEAMAAGLPVLVSNRCGCSADLVRDGVNGFTFDPLDVELLAGLMAKVASSGDGLLRMGEASRRIIAEWPLERFAEGLAGAVRRAAPARRARLADAALLHILMGRPAASVVRHAE